MGWGLLKASCSSSIGRSIGPAYWIFSARFAVNLMGGLAMTVRQLEAEGPAGCQPEGYRPYGTV